MADEQITGTEELLAEYMSPNSFVELEDPNGIGFILNVAVIKAVLPLAGDGLRSAPEGSVCRVITTEGSNFPVSSSYEAIVRALIQVSAVVRKSDAALANPVVRLARLE